MNYMKMNNKNMSMNMYMKFKASLICCFAWVKESNIQPSQAQS